MSDFVQQSFTFLGSPQRLPRRNAVIEAGAGTGKTTRIVKEVVTRLLEERDLAPERIVLITFTEKAAAEIADRVRWALTDLYLGRDAERLAWPRGSAQPVIEVPAEKRAAYLEACQRQLQSADRLKSQTIHSFCQSLLRLFPIEAGLDPRFGIVQGYARTRLMQEVFDAWMHEEMTGGAEAFVAQWRVIIERLGWLERVRDAIFALAERRELLDDPRYSLGSIDDLHERIASAVSSLRGLDPDRCAGAAIEIVEYFRRTAPPATPSLAGWGGYFEPIAEALKSADLRHFKGANAADVKLIRGEDKKRTIHDVLTQHEAAVAIRDTTRRFVAAVDAEKLRRGVVDFDDLLLRTDRLLEIPEVLSAIRERFDYIFVDEFQDTDRLQAKLVDRLARGADGKLVAGRTVLVGDPKQSIYSFRRADPEMFAQTVERFILEGADREYLEHQYRSDPPLVDAINAIFGELFVGSDDDAVARPAYRALTAARKEPRRRERCRLRFLAADAPENEDRDWIEAQLAADYIERDAAGNDFSRYAILLRKMTAAAVYADVFEHRGIPLLLPPGRALLEQRACVDLVAVLRAIAHPFDRGATIAAARTPYFGLSDEEIAAYYLYGEEAVELRGPYAACLEEISRFERASHELTVEELVELVIGEREIETYYHTLRSGKRSLAHLERFRDLTVEFTASTGGSLRHFVDELTRRRLQGEEAEPLWADESIDAVRLMTVHASKGLEFETVILPDLGSATRPDDMNVFVVDDPPLLAMTGNLQTISADYCISSGRTLRQIEKERDAAELDRLFYVAVTRARSHVVFVTTIGKKSNQSFWKPLTTCFDFDVKSFDTLFSAEKGEVERFMNVGAAAVPVMFERAATPVRAEGDLPRFVSTAIDAIVRGSNPKDFARSTFEPVRTIDAADVARRRAAEKNRLSGIALHRALELWRGELEDIGQVLRRVEREFGLDTASSSDVEKRLRLIAASETFSRIRSASPVGREMPVYFDAGGETREGRLDLLLREADAFLVVDYKRGTPHAERVEKDSLQVRQYCEALRAATGEDVRGLLWYIDLEHDQSVEVR